jgi:hypothetical protein
MNKELSIVLSPESRNYRKVAQEWYGLTNEQMADMDVHHNPSRQEGGRNIPEHLFVYHNTLHSAVHGNDFTQWARKGGKKGSEKNHSVKNEEGKSVTVMKMNEKVHKEKDENGKSVHAVKSGKKAGRKAHEAKNEEGKSILAVRRAKKSHEKKNEEGKSVNAVKAGVRAAAKINAVKNSEGKSVAGVKGAQNTTRQVWESLMDGFRGNPANVERHNIANGWDPKARVKLA